MTGVSCTPKRARQDRDVDDRSARHVPGLLRVRGHRQACMVATLTVVEDT